MTADQVWPDHLLDLDEWHALPEDSSRRFELAEGVLRVSPRAVVRHQRVMLSLAMQLDAAANGRWLALPEVEVEVEVDSGPAPTVRVPDIVLARPDVRHDAPRLGAAEILAAVEVLAPGTRRLDRALKAHEYAQAGIGWYLRVEPGPPVTLTELRLVGGAYVEVAEHVGRGQLGLGPTVDLATAS